MKINLPHFCSQLSTLLQGGQPVVSALEVLAPGAGRRIVQPLILEVRRGRSLADAMAMRPRLFPAALTGCVRLGEHTGATAEILAQYAEIVLKRDAFRKKMIKAVSYPAFVVVMGIAVGLGAVQFILPIFQGVFSEGGIPLPWMTRAVLAVSACWQKVGASGSLIVIAGGLATWYWIQRGAGKARWDTLLWKLSWVRLFWIQHAFGLLGLCLKSGIPIISAMHYIQETIPQSCFQRQWMTTKMYCKQGCSFSQSLARAGFPADAHQLISAHETHGQLPERLAWTADYYRQRLESSVETAVGILEPAAILLSGALVMALVLSLMLPLVEMTKNIQ